VLHQTQKSGSNLARALHLIQHIERQRWGN
jgi:hypothetical protein